MIIGHSPLLFAYVKEPPSSVIFPYELRVRYSCTKLSYLLYHGCQAPTE